MASAKRPRGAKYGDAGDSLNKYTRPAHSNAPPEPPLWHGHAWQPTVVEYDWGTGKWSDGYQPGPGDKPRF